MSQVNRKIFLTELKEQFPDLEPLLDAQEGMFEWEVSVFLRYVQEQIDSGDKLITKIFLERVDRYYRTGDQALREFIRNGICEDMRFEDSKKITRSWAQEYLSRALKSERDTWIESMGAEFRK